MRWLGYVLLALTVLVILTAAVTNDAGYVLLSWRLYTLELTLTTLLISLLLLAWLILQLIRVSVWLSARGHVQFADEIDTKPVNRG